MQSTSELDSWILVTKQEVDEAEPPSGFPEDRRLEILAAVSRQTAFARDRSALVTGVLRELEAAFPKAERKTIFLVEDGELIADAFWPPDRSYASFTLARRAVKSRQALLWIRHADPESLLAASLADTVSALYAPMLCGGRVVGAIHLDSTAVGVVFDQRDLDLLAVIANTAGPALRSVCQETCDLPSAFISYAREDRVFINRLAADLRRRRIKVWFDERLKSGEPWQDQISMAIACTDACVVIISPHSLASEQIENELRTALAKSRTILPVMLEGSVHFGLIEALQYIDFQLGYDDGLTELADRIKELRQEPSRKR
jgi:GAF domain-containing protein